jgi:hypothetical protein
LQDYIKNSSTTGVKSINQLAANADMSMGVTQE